MSTSSANIPCVVPSHGVTSHQPGSQAGVHCAALGARLASKSGSTQSALGAPPTSSQSAAESISIDEVSTGDELGDVSNFQESTEYYVTGQEGDRFAMVLAHNPDFPTLSDSAPVLKEMGKYNDQVKELSDGSVLFISEPCPAPGGQMSPYETMEELYESLGWPEDDEGEGPWLFNKAGILKA